jgi:hypothetical protein
MEVALSRACLTDTSGGAVFVSGAICGVTSSGMKAGSESGDATDSGEYTDGVTLPIDSRLTPGGSLFGEKAATSKLGMSMLSGAKAARPGTEVCSSRGSQARLDWRPDSARHAHRVVVRRPVHVGLGYVERPRGEDVVRHAVVEPRGVRARGGGLLAVQRLWNPAAAACEEDPREH